MSEFPPKFDLAVPMPGSDISILDCAILKSLMFPFETYLIHLFKITLEKVLTYFSFFFFLTIKDLRQHQSFLDYVINAA